MKEERLVWDSESIRSLRTHLGLSQAEMAGELGTRQQTISEWETGVYSPRGMSERLLSLVAERAGFIYETKSTPPAPARNRLDRSTRFD